MSSKRIVKKAAKVRKVKGLIDDIINGGKAIIQPIIRPILGRKKTGPPVSSYAKNVMRGNTFKVKASGGGAGQIVTGSDFLTSVTIPSLGADVGSVLVNVVANPYSLGISRLKQVAPLYQRYFFKNLTVEYVPICGATTVGQIIGYFDYDVTNDPSGTSGQSNLSRAAAHYGQKPVQVWQGAESKVAWTLKRVDNLTDLYCKTDGIDNHWTDQGRFVLLAATEWPVTSEPFTVGSLYVHYEVEFFVNQLGEDITLGHTSKFGSGTTAITSTGTWLNDLNPASWNDLPCELKNNYITLPPGHYCATAVAYNLSSSTAQLTTMAWDTEPESVTVVNNWADMSKAGGTSWKMSAFIQCYNYTQNVQLNLMGVLSGSSLSALQVYVSACPDPQASLMARKCYGKFNGAISTRRRVEKAKQMGLYKEETKDDIPMSTSSSISSVAKSSLSANVSATSSSSTSSSSSSCLKQSPSDWCYFPKA